MPPVCPVLLYLGAGHAGVRVRGFPKVIAGFDPSLRLGITAFPASVFGFPSEGLGVSRSTCGRTRGPPRGFDRM